MTLAMTFSGIDFSSKVLKVKLSHCAMQTPKGRGVIDPTDS
jgi:hypothetical protein